MFFEDVVSIRILCETCKQEYAKFDGNVKDLLNRVIRQIDRKVRTGDWKSVKESQD
jgi:hypothetical protein